jgi:hypothetical protein
MPDTDLRERPADQPAAGPGRPAGFSPRGMLVTLVPNVVLPWIIYQALTAQGVSTINALMATAIVPLATTLYGWLSARRVEALGIMTLAFVVVGLVTSLISGDPFFYLIKESLLTGVWGLIMLGSLLARKPLTYYFGRQFMAGGDPARAAWYDSLWQKPQFRAIQRWICIMWGVGLVAEALLRVVLVYVLPISVFLLVSQVLAFGVMGVLMVATMLVGKRMRARAERRAAEARARAA